MTNKQRWVAIVSVVLVGVLVVILSLYGWVNGVRNTAISFERQLTSQYLSNQNNLSAYISGFYEQVSVAETQSDVLNDILLDAVKGRYDSEQGGFDVDSALFSAVVEAYPEASAQELLANWGKIQDYITAGRESYKNVQDMLLDQLRAYDTWREQGFVRSIVVSSLGFPSHRLEARVGDNTYYGLQARDRMYRIVLTSDALRAYEEGTMDPLEVP
ncbi:MAG: hypothetical protein R3346_03575 [Candidatus Spechtbacterales bacterium]|nr:hypothetical protein [Candidatus Spechtbacterales bacterium]